MGTVCENTLAPWSLACDYLAGCLLPGSRKCFPHQACDRFTLLTACGPYSRSKFLLFTHRGLVLAINHEHELFWQKGLWIN